MDRVWCRRSICSMEQKRAAIETYIRLDYCGADTIAEFAYGCSHLEAALDIELGRPCLLFRSARVILQTSLFGADFRYYPPTCNCEAIKTQQGRCLCMGLSCYPASSRDVSARSPIHDLATFFRIRMLSIVLTSISDKALSTMSFGSLGTFLGGRLRDLS